MFLYIGVLIIVTFQLKEKNVYKNFHEIFQPEEEKCFYFIVGNYILYFIGTLVYFFCYCMLYSSVDRTEIVTWIDIILIIINLSWAIFGSISCWT